ncbi:protein DEHYDRATION-INDUCED 19 homolog 5 isoform X2 [Brachypodium distachyon]|uniref:Drought induced 19 protein type zinc-binding domain-containing protein n=1 Tax=Brachypodium distachyon TaxID=15368 RepID=I1HVL5_BRADI|nr:protein DEHYDRATION-INDUCED 19 homolog 5 isoform X2 [Brachypodium distachyon]KQK11735.1 hypothetical protein BRADI_2g61990v3 [Brachypodium distachyon]PNT73665.1 hypothetical protein BRADI_2g61990v3 [Brachypodium distachyon]|eukprot:XP_003565167.1 protein DEHYDRATION-INDUCED 19 homolog 5 isoform X2 [Brachypodium distachyon]
MCCCVSYSYTSSLPTEKSREEQQCSVAMEVEAQASYSYGFLPSGRHQPYAPHPPHPPDGELWEYFPCPFCYIEVEMPFICNHLQEEHCFDTRNAVCPICAENLGKNMSAHFRVQHSHLLKRRKPSKPSSWPSAAHGEEPYEVNSYMMNNRLCQDPEPDPLLSQFICSADQTESKSRDRSRRHGGGSSATSDVQRSGQRVSQLELEERLQRVEFLKEIITSTII